MIYVLDASAILRLTDREAGFQRVVDLLEKAADGNASVLISAVNWGEVVSVLHRRIGDVRARSAIAELRRSSIHVVDVAADDAEAAGELRARFSIPYADAFAAQLTSAHSTGRTRATLVTADHDFKALPKGSIEIEFLPAR